MNKKLDLKNKIVNFYDVDTNLVEDEIVSYLDRHMKVRFFGAHFNNNKYVFLGSPKDKHPNSITISNYRIKKPNENVSVEIS
jgi:hypothetical protein